MESPIETQSAKPAGNTALYLVLAICYSGLFLMVLRAILLASVFALGGRVTNLNLSYLLAVSFYLAFVVLAMTGVMLNFRDSDSETKIPATIAGFRRRR